MTGNKFFLKCFKCNAWYTASCHWYVEHDKITYQLRDKDGKPAPWKDKNGKLHYEATEVLLPRIKIENVEAHQCARGNKEYGV